MASKTKPRTKPSNTWHCPECNADFDFAAFSAHLRDKHGIIDTKGKRTMTMHLDGYDFYSSVYDWEIGGKHFTQTTVDPRRGKDAGMWR